jgi:ABC-type nitrate/sulfonate/bicarbonate transport system substrate-binding protein
MTVQVQVYMWHKTTSTEALLDSGATHNFIDERAIQTLGMGTRELPQPLQVNTVDGTANPVTHFCNLWLRQGGKTVKQGFYVTNLGKDRIILGHPWFKAFNPTIDWKTNALHGENLAIETAGF